MNDTILLAESEEKLRSGVAEALKLYREGDLLTLSTVALAHTSLVESCFLSGEPITPDARGRMMGSLLRWAVDKVRPSGQPSWTQPAWRAYNILRHFYLEAMRASSLAEAMAVAEQTLYQWRPQAIAALTRLLREELAAPADAQTRKHYALADRYARHTPPEQQLLRIVAVFPHAIPATLLHQLAATFQLTTVTQSVGALVAAHLLISSEEGARLVVQPEARGYLLTLLHPQERQTLHRAAGDYYTHQGDFLEAARQLRLGGWSEAAATLLVEQRRAIIDNLQIEELGELVAQFRAVELSPGVWARLKIVAGEIAEFTRDLDSALAEYQQALNAPDLHTKATAYYHRAKAFAHKNIDESLAHYAYGIHLLAQDNGRPENATLLVHMYIQRAWIFIQVRPDLGRAELDLNEARRRIDPADRRLWCDLYNALGEFYHRKGQPEESVQHYWQAWLAANEVRDGERMSQTAHNLGLVYRDDLRQYDQALDYLQRSADLARQTGNHQMEGLCAMSIGVCYFWLTRFAEAIASYTSAAEIFEGTGNRTLLTRTEYGLAEAYAELGDLPTARRYFEEGLTIAQELGDAGAIADFAEFARQYPQVVQTPKMWSSRQQQALDYVQQQAGITNRAYQQLTGVSQKQAVRDLNELVEGGMLTRIGNGRATRYVRTGA